MTTTRVRFLTSGSTSFVAFVSIGSARSVRVRWIPTAWKCDAHPLERTGGCEHVQAVLNSPTFKEIAGDHSG